MSKTSLNEPSPLYDLKINTLQGKPYDLNALRGKVVLVVNTATECGFTKQLTGLEELHKKYASQGLEVLGVPCNQFGGQEPGDADHVMDVCKKNFGVTFPLTEKVEVNGDNTHPLYVWLKAQKSQLMMSRIKWNFEKFLLDRDGHVVDRFASTTTPESLVSQIESLLTVPPKM